MYVGSSTVTFSKKDADGEHDEVSLSLNTRNGSVRLTRNREQGFSLDESGKVDACERLLRLLGVVLRHRC